MPHGHHRQEVHDLVTVAPEVQGLRPMPRILSMRHVDPAFRHPVNVDRSSNRADHFQNAVVPESWDTGRAEPRAMSERCQANHDEQAHWERSAQQTLSDRARARTDKQRRCTVNQDSSSQMDTAVKPYAGMSRKMPIHAESEACRKSKQTS
jgi:hypothetical protein